MRTFIQKHGWPVTTLVLCLTCLLYAGCAQQESAAPESQQTSAPAATDGELIDTGAAPGSHEFEDAASSRPDAPVDAPAESLSGGPEGDLAGAGEAGGFGGQRQAGDTLQSPAIAGKDEAQDFLRRDTPSANEGQPAAADDAPAALAATASASETAPAPVSDPNSGPTTPEPYRGRAPGEPGPPGAALGSAGVPVADSERAVREGEVQKRLSVLQESAESARPEPAAESRAAADRTVVSIDLQPGEELWVIARTADQGAAPEAPEGPRCGALLATLPNETKQVPVPLKHTSVTGNIDGYIATVDVTQQFHNPYSSKIEAVYVFPLPQNAAVSEFVMTIGERKIRGIIREREQAERIYQAAREQGHVASLLTQERPNIFTQHVANIEPGRQIDIQLRYFNTLPYDDGALEFVFPMVVGPRFNPPHITDGIGAVPRGGQNTSGQQTEVQYLAPHERSGHDVAITVNLDAGVDIESVESVNHSVDVRSIGSSGKQIVLTDSDTIPNRDFVLRCHVAGDQVKTALMTHRDDHGQYFTMMLYPPRELESVPRCPMEMVFVLDCSGSMNGRPIEQAKQAIACALQSLTPRDTFQIIRFSSNASQLGTVPVPATPENIQQGLNYLASLSGSGGTHMIEGIRAALHFPHDEGRFRLVSFMTDGYIGNEQEILHTMAELLGPSRVFSFGVGQSPNRYLMDRMAGMGRGAVAYLSLNDNAQDVMDHFSHRISHPAMTDLSIEWGSMQVTDVYPQRLPDLIVGRPVIVTGKFTGEPGVVSVGGRVGMQPASFAVAVDEEDAARSHAGIAAVWARLKIKDLAQSAVTDPASADAVRTQITQTALDHGLMSAYTAFVAVDSTRQTAGDYGTTVAVPVPTPEGVRYETTVGNGSN